MSETKTLLFEIGVEELPTKAVGMLSEQLKALVSEHLSNQQLAYESVISFGTPRRLAITVEGLIAKQADYKVEKKGPAVNIAFDDAGNPSKALEGFARSNQTTLESLSKKEMNGTEFVFFEQHVAGKQIKDLIPELLVKVLKQLPIAKPMRWGSSSIEFVRPIHWVCLMFGDEVITTEILGVKTSNKTYGHRFHAPAAIELKHANNYVKQLQPAGFVMPSFTERKKYIHDKVQQLAKNHDAIAVIDESLLDDVAGLVEWPVPLLIDFDPAFLQVPEEALISAMQTHQKVFHLIDKAGNLVPKFITIANIESKNKQSVIQGNSRVMKARLADAAFFFETDKKQTLESRLEILKHIVFQKQLGTLYERAERLSILSRFIAEKLNLDTSKAEKAGLLAKTDLVSQMVEEFPELQGTMGYHYAVNEALDNDIAMGIRGQYMPRFSGDALPGSDYGCAVSLADRLDKLVGIFGINQPPTGEKDPFALRRAAIGLLNIIIEKHFHLDLKELISFAKDLYTTKLTNNQVENDVYEFIMERLKHWYQSKGIRVELFNAVREKNISELNDFNLRLNAVKTFADLEESQALAAANKRVSNILTKENIQLNDLVIQPQFLTEAAEKSLAEKISIKQNSIAPLVSENEYTKILQSLADLRDPIDNFFDEVMVMVDNEALKRNRIALLNSLRNLFLEVADISKL